MTTEMQRVQVYAGVMAVCQLLNKQRFDVHNEKILQSQIETVLHAGGVPFERECRLDDKSIIDFLVDQSIGIEIKIKGSSMDIFRQLQRYLEFDEVQALILVTNKAIRLPKTVNGKFTYVLNLGKSWL